jgi:autotransporter-associated beta strand protein
MLTGGLLSLGNAGALGGGDLTLAGGELLATVNQAVAIQLAFTNPGGSQSAVIAAAHGKRLILIGQEGSIFGPGVSLDFGTPSADGLVIWLTPPGVIGTPSAVTVAGGILRAGDSGFSSLFPQAGPVTVAAGGVIDLAGFATTISNLEGGGKVGNSRSATTLTLFGAEFSGSIVGALSLEVPSFAGVMLTGANAYTGSTTIDAGGILTLGKQDGLTGSLRATSPIINNGELDIARGNALTLANPISGSGSLAQIGQGRTR